MNIPDLRNNNKNRYAWVDVETTGLSLEKDKILEVACIITDSKLNVQGQISSVIKHNHVPEMNEIVQRMHESNGLLREIKDDSFPSLSEFGRVFLTFLEKFKPQGFDLYLVGNSLSGVDIPFLKRDYPGLWKEFGGPLHYRSIDITGFGLGIQLMTGEYPEIKKTKAHRAMDDVRECISEYKNIHKYILDNHHLFLNCQ